MNRRRDPAYCFGVAGIAKAPWRPTLGQARADAVEAGFAWHDEFVPRQIYLHALAEIWTTHELVPVLPRADPATNGAVATAATPIAAAKKRRP